MDAPPDAQAPKQLKNKTPETNLSLPQTPKTSPQSKPLNTGAHSRSFPWLEKKRKLDLQHSRANKLQPPIATKRQTDTTQSIELEGKLETKSKLSHLQKHHPNCPNRDAETTSEFTERNPEFEAKHPTLTEWTQRQAVTIMDALRVCVHTKDRAASAAGPPPRGRCWRWLARR
jgi:hypothetical protein